MIVFRLSKAQFANDLSGKGAELVGGRWNSRGNAMLYTFKVLRFVLQKLQFTFRLGFYQKIINWYILKFLMKIFRIEKITKDWQTFPHSNSN